MRPRPVLHEAEAETKTNYRETETETETEKSGLETLTSLPSVSFHNGALVPRPIISFSAGTSLGHYNATLKKPAIQSVTKSYAVTVL